MTTTAEQLEQWRGRSVVDAEGNDLGKLDEVYYSASGEPVLARVSSGLLGRHHALIPLAESAVGRDYLRVAFRKEQIDRASGADVGEVIDRDDAARVGQAYGLVLPGAEQGYESSSQRQARQLAAIEAQERAAALDAEAHRLGQDAAITRAQAEDVGASATQAERDAAAAREAAERARLDAEAAAAAAAVPPSGA